MVSQKQYTTSDTKSQQVPDIDPFDSFTVDIPFEDDESSLEIRQYYQAVVKPGQIVEIRCLDAMLIGDKLPYNKPRVIAGWFDNVESIITEVRKIGQAAGIYMTINPCTRDLLARANNQFKSKSISTTSDDQIVTRQILPIDIDSVRLAGIPANDTEHQSAIALAQTIRDTLGWPMPIELDSGNGAYLEYAIDMPTQDDGLIQRVLQGIAQRFDTAQAHVDTTTYNPARIMRVPETMNCKGDGTGDRPHRMAKLISVPDTLQVVTREQLESIAAPVEQPKQSKEKSSSDGNQQSSSRVDWLEKFMANHGIQVKSSGVKSSGDVCYQLEACAWNPDHTDDCATLFVKPNGMLGANCNHNSCEGKGWKDFRRVFEPDFDKKKSDNYAKTASNMRDYLKTDKDQEQEDVWIDGKKVEDPYIMTIRRKIVNFLKDFPPFEQDHMIFNHFLSQILCELPSTDHGNAIRLSARYGHLFRYVSEQKSFYAWDGKRWTEDKVGRVMAWARETVQFINIEANSFPPLVDENGEPLIRPHIGFEQEPTQEEARIIEIFEKRDTQIYALEKWSKQSQSKRALEAMMGVSQSERIEQGGMYDTSISISQLDCHDWLFNCINGTLDLEDTNNIKFMPHNPEHLSTKLAPVNYDPTILCPEWDACMLKFCSDSHDLVQFHQDLVGCGLVGKQLDDILAVAFGPGGNGKGIFAETLKGCLGEYASTAKSDLLLEKKSESINNDQAALNGVRFLTLSENDENRKLSENTVKSLTGGDTIPVRFLFKEYFNMLPKFTGILFTNHKPIIQGTDQGIWRRVKFIPWLHDFEHDPDVKNRQTMLKQLKAEYSGILNWALAGLAHRMQTELIQVPAIVTDITTTYREQSDSLKEFIEDYCVTDEKDAKENRQFLYDAYSKYAETEAGQSKIATKRSFLAKLRERRDIPFFRDTGEGIKSGAVRYVFGIRLLKEGEMPHHKKEENLSEASQNVKKAMEDTMLNIQDLPHETRTLFYEYTQCVIKAIESNTMVQCPRGNFEPEIHFDWIRSGLVKNTNAAVKEMQTVLGR